MAAFGVGEDWLLPSDFHAEAPLGALHVQLGQLGQMGHVIDEAEFGLSPQLAGLMHGSPQTTLAGWHLATTPYGAADVSPMGMLTVPPQVSPAKGFSLAKRKYGESETTAAVQTEPPSSKQRVAATSIPREAGKPLRDTTSPPDDLSPDEPTAGARDQVVHFRSRAVGRSEDQTVASKPTKPRPAANETLRPPPSATHRSSFAQRFFTDLIAGNLSAFGLNGKHPVTVLQDVAGPNASWRPKHQLPSKCPRSSPFLLRCVRKPSVYAVVCSCVQTAGISWHRRRRARRTTDSCAPSRSTRWASARGADSRVARSGTRRRQSCW